MKTSLNFLPLFFAAALAATFAAEIIGLQLSSGFDSMSAFVGFAAALVLNLAAGDYARLHRPLSANTPVALAKAAHPLAA
jgi:hypothetical protein